MQGRSEQGLLTSGFIDLSSNFAQIIRKKKLFVDKSLLIKELLDKDEQVTLITRPRRWGKTLNMSMIDHFFSRTVNEEETASLFHGLKISQVDEGKYLNEHQGKYPVIFISFKDLKENSYIPKFLQNAIFMLSLFLLGLRLKASNSQHYCEFLIASQAKKSNRLKHRILKELGYKSAISKTKVLVKQFYERHAYLTKSKKLD